MNSSNSKNHQIEVDSREFLGQSHQPKRHKVHKNLARIHPQNSAKKITRALKITKKENVRGNTRP
jgi:hypothetical protein